MRLKDNDKKQALFNATIKLVNEIGFDSSSVSKIAREAGVSPATLYIYFDNKEDLLVSTYVQIKLKTSKAVLNDFDDTLPIREALKDIWVKMFKHMTQNQDEYKFAVQFANSPYISLVNREELEAHYEPILALLQKGIEQKLIKNVETELLTVFVFYPLTYLTNPRSCSGSLLGNIDIDTAFTMAWDAIKV